MVWTGPGVYKARERIHRDDVLIHDTSEFRTSPLEVEFAGTPIRTFTT